MSEKTYGQDRRQGKKARKALQKQASDTRDLTPEQWRTLLNLPPVKR